MKLTFHDPVVLLDSKGNKAPNPLTIEGGLNTPVLYTVAPWVPDNKVGYEYDAEVDEGLLTRHLKGEKEARESEEHPKREIAVLSSKPRIVVARDRFHNF